MFYGAGRCEQWRILTIHRGVEYIEPLHRNIAIASRAELFANLLEGLKAIFDIARIQFILALLRLLRIHIRHS